MLQNYQVPSVLLGLFLRKLEVQDVKKMVESLPWRLPEFDGQPRANNVPKEAPADVPRLAFTSKDGRKVLEIAPAKIQFRMVPGELIQGEGNRMGLKTVNMKDAFESFIPMVLKIHSVFSEHYALSANRIGVLTEFLAPIGSSSNQRLHEFIFGGKNLFGERLHETQVHALAKTTLVDGDRQVNRWIRVRTLRNGDAAGQDSAIAVEVDVNTLPEDTYDLSAADIEKFLRNLVEHLDNRVPLLSDEGMFKG